MREEEGSRRREGKWEGQRDDEEGGRRKQEEAGGF
jgi:hypothetical protein